jgi:hypothetical protein
MVTRDVPAYAVVAGVPARVKHMRFSPEVISRIEASRWWELDKSGIAALLREHPDWIHDPASLLGTSIV